MSEILGTRPSLSNAETTSSSSSGRTSRSVDVFSLGCVFHTALTDGRHPFGEWYEREANIMRDRRPTENDDLAAVSFEAADLVDRMIDRDACNRPTARDVRAHPYFWDAPRRAAFLCELSDRLEASHHTTHNNNNNNNTNNNNNKDMDPTRLESGAAEVVGRAWDRRLDAALVTDTSRFRSYDPSSVRDCLRFVRNKHRHFDELSEETRAAVGVSDARDLARYFDAVFPRLLPHCYDVCRNHMDPDDALRRKYRIVGARSDLPKEEEAADSRPETTTVSKENNDDDDQSTTDDTRRATTPITPTTPTPTPTTPTPNTPTTPTPNTPSLVAWRDSETAASLGCLGWSRSTAFWVGEPASALRTRHAATTRRPGGADPSRRASDPRYRTRLCNHWDVSKGARCPLRRKRCVFAHGPVELRVKEGKRGRWGRLVDRNGDCSNPRASGGEDTYGAARDVENARKGEGKWSTDDVAVAAADVDATERESPPRGRRRGKPRGGGIPTGA